MNRYSMQLPPHKILPGQVWFSKTCPMERLEIFRSHNGDWDVFHKNSNNEINVKKLRTYEGFIRRHFILDTSWPLIDWGNEDAEFKYE